MVSCRAEQGGRGQPAGVGSSARGSGAATAGQSPGQKQGGGGSHRPVLASHPSRPVEGEAAGERPELPGHGTHELSSPRRLGRRGLGEVDR